MSASAAAAPTSTPAPTSARLRLLCTHTLRHVVVVFFFGAFACSSFGCKKMHLGKNNEANMSPRLPKRGERERERGSRRSLA